MQASVHVDEGEETEQERRAGSADSEHEREATREQVEGERGYKRAME